MATTKLDADLQGTQVEEKKSFWTKEMRRKERVTGNVLDAVIQIISLAIVQNHLATKIKRPSLEVLRAIAKMTLKTKPTMKLVSWLNRRMRWRWRGDGGGDSGSAMEMVAGLPIRRIKDFDESKDHRLTLKNTSYPHQRYAIYNTLVNEEEPTDFISIRRIQQEDTAYMCLHFTRNHEELKIHMPVWKSVRYGVSKELDTAYWGFLGVGTTHGYAISSLMDTAYWSSECYLMSSVPFEEQSDDLKKKLAKNNKAKMVLDNALPKNEYERIFLCKTTKDIWQSLLITHQEESIDSGFARFNTIITSLKALDKGFSSKNYVRKFLRALHPKWKAKVTTIEESKDLSSLALDELIGNLKVHEVVMEKDSEIYRGKKERVKSIALKAKKEYSDDETSTSGSDDKEYAMAVRNFKKFFRRKGKFVRQPREEKKSFRQRDEKKGKSDRKCFRCGDPNHLIGDCPKPSRNKDQKAFIGGSWSDSENDTEDKTNDETCLMAQSSNEVTLNSSHYSDNASSLDNDSMQIEYDSLCEISLKIINKNKILKTKRDLLEKEILELNEKIKKLERSKEVDITCKSCDELKLENAKLKETQDKFVKFDKSANSLREMLNNQKSPSYKIGLGLDSDKASTSGTKTVSFVG
ncbi:zf-CCHC domain-containing protein [Tanacetum coccineum]